VVQNFKFKVKEKKQLAGQVFFYVLELVEPAKIEFKAGQFLNIKIGENIWKPYSICSAPYLKNKIELVVDVSPAGKGSAFFEKLHVGDEVLGNGPFGTFVVHETTGDLVFIATGSGIAPVRSMIRDMEIWRYGDTKKNKPIKITLFFGLRYVTDIYFFDEFEKLAKENSNFRFYGTLSKPDARWQGLRGRVTAHLEKLENSTNKDYYLCGNPETVNALKIYLVTCGVNENNIHYEQY